MGQVPVAPVVIPWLTPGDIARFWRKVDRRGPDECWEWRGYSNSLGYGILSKFVGGKKQRFRAHRISLAIDGRDPHDNLACHHCDNPKCVNPSHLFVGNQVANMRDCFAKGKHNNGSKSHCKYGHPFTGSNLRFTTNGHRLCVACARKQSKLVKARKRDALRAAKVSAVFDHSHSLQAGQTVRVGDATIE